MNPLESQLDYPFGDQVPEPGTVSEIAPGVLWVRMALPFALNHINLWLLEDVFETDQGSQPGWTLIDCGIDNDVTRQAWERIFTTHLRGLPIRRVLATHCHPDHAGLAHWICQRWQAPLWMSAGEYAFARLMSAALPGADGTSAVGHFQRHGLSDPAMLEQLEARRNYYPSLVPAVPQAYVRLRAGQQVKIGRDAWQVIVSAGHSPEHVALYCPRRKLLVSGDMVLPRISTNVSVFAIEPEASPVQAYLDSLLDFAVLPADTLVLPAHGKPFYGLRQRIAQLQDHHAARLEEVLAACDQPQSAAEIVPRMFRRPLDAHQLSFALGEALAHLHKLWYDGLLKRTTGPDGVIRFVKS